MHPPLATKAMSRSDRKGPGAFASLHAPYGLRTTNLEWRVAVHEPSPDFLGRAIARPNPTARICHPPDR